MKTAELTGQDLVYWVARANTSGSRQEVNVVRKHYGFGTPKHDPCDEPAMRAFVFEKFGNELPPQHMWK